jgi:hypothetical protein
MAEARSERSNIPPYVPYRTFLNFLDGLKVGVPSHIDKSVLSSLSGGMQSWLKASLRYMKLIDHGGQSQERLYDLVSYPDSEGRKRQMAALFNETYKPIRDLVELEVTTPAKLEQAFVQLGANGETVKKCMAFLLAFGKDAEIELSPHLLKRASTPRRGRQLRSPGRVVNPNGDESPARIMTETGPAMRTVRLPKVGGNLTLSGNFNAFDLDDDERELVFLIIDKMKAFEAKQTTEGGEP